MQCAKCGHVRFEAGKISNLVTLQIRYCRSEPGTMRTKADVRFTLSLSLSLGVCDAVVCGRS
jgi:hypothetical protein